MAKKRLTQEEFINRSNFVHHNKYDYSKAIYVNDATKVCIICPEHGEFWQTPNHHFHGQGCPKCAIDKNTVLHRMNIDDFIKSARKIHDDKYDYSKVNDYVNSKTKVCIICPKHGEFYQSADNHLRSHGCPKCGNQISMGEDEIKSFIEKKCCFKVEQNVYNIISPYELDIYVPDKKVAIEYDGLIWHSEKFGKDKTYHLMKTELCEKQGIRLIHIFEDEWLEHKEIVKSKLRHILGVNKNEKIYARKCVIKEITYSVSKVFLNKNHIQGDCVGSIYIGAFYKDELIGCIVFKKEKNNMNYELVRLATDNNKKCIGVASKMFNYFVKNFLFEKIKTFADRRWSSMLNNTLYDMLGFKLTDILPPDYSYVDDNKNHFHKFLCRKKKLIRNYPAFDLNEDMTEREMTEKVGLYRIWNCGLLKYEYK